jgi:hypothetical protein
MKKYSMILAAVALVAVMAGSAAAADHVAKSTLSNMGFGSASIMSDADGLAVRGKGTYAYAWGQSSASYYNRNGGNTSYNGYDVGATHKYGSSTAVGANASVAGSASNYGFKVNFAGGGSFGYAK